MNGHAKNCDRATLAINPFPCDSRTDEPGGIAMVTSAPDAVTAHQKVAETAWRESVKGAVAAGYDSLWVTRGIYAAELGIEPGDEPDPDRIVEVCDRHRHWPTAAIATFRW